MLIVDKEWRGKGIGRFAVRYAEHFLKRKHKKVGNAYSKLLAYRSFVCIQTIQSGEVDLEQFLGYKQYVGICTTDDNLPAKHLYEACGYEVVGKIPVMLGDQTKVIQIRYRKKLTDL